MKKLLSISLLFFAVPVFAQQTIQDVNHQRNEINLTGMKILGGWALANMAVGSIAYFKTSGKNKYFHQMNVFWNVANLGLATAGYFGAKADLNQQLNLARSVHDQHKIEKILLLNAGLDVGYMATGLFLNERGKNKSSDRLKGYGNSLILQGAFLLIFDSGMYVIHNHNGNGLDKILEKVSVNFDGEQIGITYSINHKAH
ncbi:hypothetical protein A5893_09705 [Pedobacter psychrophilus]|uniref:Uncharacterized protein n=1 Tax=Pedobacter psychrophilus TaxID=1826909 RepID=A0A179DFL4_9SPHI|nr:hypothetical protein [Pedobacter psychrophilus]OAQ39836.1 hypothetical protein A5893_09705 [Pedobacter psychrophilus]